MMAYSALHDVSVGGRVAQVVNYIDGEVDTSATLIPYDDNIPQNDEGEEWKTLEITPSASGNKLKIDVSLMISAPTGGDRFIAALFQDDGLDAVAVQCGSQGSSTGGMPNPLSLTHYMAAVSTDPTTFKVRYGAQDAGPVTINGAGGSRLFGGVASSSITITEIGPGVVFASGAAVYYG
jgi:hypothetical protein